VTRLAVLLLLTPSSLFAQAPADNPGTIRIGALTLKPMFAIKNIGRDNNVFNEATDPKRDFTLTLSPSVELVFQPGRFKFTLLEGTDYVYFKQYTTERGMNYSSSARVDVDLGVLRPYATIAGTNSKERYNNEVDARARHRDESYSAGVGLKLFTRTTGSIGVRHATSRFDQGQTFRGASLPDAFDSHTDSIEGSIGLALTPMTSFAVNVSREQQRFEQATDRNADTIRVMPTLSFSPAGLINGTVAVGFRRFTALDARTPDFTGLIASATGGVTLYERHRLDFAVNRDLNFSYDRETPYYIATGGSLTWTWLFAGPVDLKASVGRNRMQYHGQGNVGPTTRDIYSTYGVGTGYRVRPRLRLGINGDWIRRKSGTSADRVFENNRIYGTVTWGT
jgi:Putative beta-barrel porin 2